MSTKFCYARLFCQRFYSTEKTNLIFKRKLDEYLATEEKMGQMGFFFPHSQQADARKPVSKIKGSLFTEEEPLYNFIKRNKPRILLQEVFLDGCRTLEDFLLGRPLQRQSQIALAALQKFYFSRRIHEARLRKLRRREVTRSETDVMSLLAVHFLTQLIPYPYNYYVDKCARFKKDVCPCGCGKPLQVGMTYIGNHDLFYGSPDVVLFPNGENLFSADGSKSSVFMTKKSKYDSASATFEDEDETEDEEDFLNEEKKYTFDIHDTKQLLKLAIAMSFCYRKMLQNGCSVKKRNEVSTIIPTCGITSDTYKIAMYDSTNDILLLSDDNDLFDDDGSIRFSAMVNLWMIIHHPLFCTGLWKDAIDQFKGSCDIESYLSGRDVQNVIDGSRWFFAIDSTPIKEEYKEFSEEVFRRPDSIMLKRKSVHHLPD